MNDTKTNRVGFALWIVRRVLLIALASGLAACGGDARVDPALVGTWAIPVPGGRWLLTIDSAGEYRFVNEAGGPALSHDGTFVARDGEWTLHSTSVALEDHGTYVADADGVTLTGSRGSLRWGRTSEAPLTAAAAPPTASAGAAAAPMPAAPPPAAPAPAPAARAAGSSATAASTSRGATVPETIDPCSLVTADEAAKLLGAAVQTVRTTPEPRTQNDCRYVAGSNSHSLAVSTYNGGGLDPAGYLARRAKEGGTPLAGVGDGAVTAFRDVTGVASANIVIGTASIEILVAGVPRERAMPGLETLARTAASRLTSPAGAFDQPGLERFVGTWLVAPSGGGRSPSDRLVIRVERDGRLDVEATGNYSGTLELDGAHWRLGNGLYGDKPPSGEYRVSGDRLSLSGETVSGDLTRVACNAAPKIYPPYDLVRDVAGFLAGKNLARIDANAPPASAFDAALAGLWEGRGKANGKPAELLIVIDSRGRTVFAVFPKLGGRLEAADGHYDLSLETLGESSGAYRFQGGIYDGTIAFEDGEQTYVWSPYDPDHRPVYETRIVGPCN